MKESNISTFRAALKSETLTQTFEPLTISPDIINNELVLLNPVVLLLDDTCLL